MVLNPPAILAGIVAGTLVVGVFEILGMVLFPPPDVVRKAVEAAGKSGDYEQLRLVASQIPLINLLVVLVAYGAGALAAGLVATGIQHYIREWLESWVQASITRFGLACNWLWLGRPRLWLDRPWPALIAAAVLEAFGTANLLMLPHPVWLAMTSILIFLPAAGFGAWMADRWTARKKWKDNRSGKVLFGQTDKGRWSAGRKRKDKASHA